MSTRRECRHQSRNASAPSADSAQHWLQSCRNCSVSVRSSDLQRARASPTLTQASDFQAQGAHLYLLVEDGGDIERFLGTLHDRCWLAGFGWMIVGRAGQLLERSIVDRTVIHPKGWYSREARSSSRRSSRTKPAARQSPPTARHWTPCPPAHHCASSSRSLWTNCGPRKCTGSAMRARRPARRSWQNRTQRIAQRTGITIDAARRTVDRQCDGILLPDVELPFDLAEIAGCSVADVIADPDRFVGATLADPLEGRKSTGAGRRR